MIRRSFVLALGLAVSAGSVLAQGKIAPNSFVGNWSGYWDNRWNMSLNVVSVSGNKAQVVYTHPEGQNSGAGTISGNTLRYRQITLTLASPTSGQAVGAFSTATRTANVTKQ